MNAYATPVVKRLSVTIAVAAVGVVAAIVAVHPTGAAASLPVPTTASASTNPAARTSIATAAAPSARTSNAYAAPRGGTGPTTTGPGATTGDASVMALQQRLAALGYDVGAADGRIGERTTASVMAFQKVEGLARTGTAGPEVTAALAKATSPRPLVPGGEATRVEIDLSRQVLLFFDQGRLTRILPVSTGSGQRYCQAGVCQNATTPKGVFHVGRKVMGVDPGPLGVLYDPMYFNGGIAIHGAPSVPATPASHGCARIPMYAAASFFNQVASGTAVYVV
jgi:peptidoglycan hydrolase-like protein with peptidoglycan-binding domain